MATDPRTFLVQNCAADINAHIKSTSQKNAFYGAAKFIGGIEGTGAIGKGLNALVKTSDVIGSGGSTSFPTNLSDEAGADKVLDAVDINPIAAKQNAPLSPGVVNRGIGSAKQIYQKVKNGTYSDISDLPDAVADLKNLKAFVDKIFTPPGGVKGRDVKSCHASPYAMDLIARAPKMKFLFLVEFIFTEPYTYLGQRTKNFTFVIKQTDRPTVQFDYEDVNMYNFKTKVIRKSTYNPISMRFYDDDTNEGMHFYNSYLRAVSPVANISNSASLEENGLDFDKRNTHAALGIPTHGYSASVGPLLKNKKTVLDSIKLFHVFDNGHLMNVYNFFSPKILELQLDELNMADSGEGSEIMLQFGYDGLYIEPNTPVNPKADGGDVNIKELTNAGNWPLRFTGEDSDDPNETSGFGADVDESDPRTFSTFG